MATAAVMAGIKNGQQGKPGCSPLCTLSALCCFSPGWLKQEASSSAFVLNWIGTRAQHSWEATGGSQEGKRRVLGGSAEAGLAGFLPQENPHHNHAGGRFRHGFQHLGQARLAIPQSLAKGRDLDESRMLGTLASCERLASWHDTFSLAEV